MEIKGWKYYNHAAIPSTPPHEDPDVNPVKDGSIWKLDGSPLLARWTTDFDCGYETNWWYIIKEAPFDINSISSKNQKSIRQALRKCYVKKIVFEDYIDEVYNCYVSAYSKYENADNMLEKDSFVRFCRTQRGIVDFWAGFDTETSFLIGFFIVEVFDDFAEIKIAKFNTEFLNKRVSDALYFTVLDFYLNNCSKKYVCSGSRSINHKSNTQEYKIKRFGYRKAYCNLHIIYNPKVKLLIRLAYLFRNVLIKMDGITIIHQINSLLKMEELIK